MAHFPWNNPEAIEKLYEMYGTNTTKAIAKTLSNRFGVALSARAVQQKAYKLGLKAVDAQGYLTLYEASRQLGVPPTTIHQHMTRKGLRSIGRGFHAFIDEETFERLKRFYAAPEEPALLLSKAAERLCYSSSHVHKLIRTGRLRGVRRGSRWLIPVSEISRFLSEQRRAG